MSLYNPPRYHAVIKLHRAMKHGIVAAIVGALFVSSVVAVSLWRTHDRQLHSKMRSEAVSSQPTPKPSPTHILATYAPSATDGLITNEYAYFNPGDKNARRSGAWQMTSGSLFAHQGAFWTGLPDSCPNGPNALSTNCTDSNVFRLNTARRFAGNVALSLSLKQNAAIHNAACDKNDTCWYGTHLWLRYQNQFNLYYASINRADGTVAIKRKVPCGPSDSGTYFVLGQYVKHDFKAGVWNDYTATIQTNGNGSVTIKLYDDHFSTSRPIVVGTDRGGINSNWSKSCTTPGHYASAVYKPITTSGNVGVRGDYANFAFKDFQVAAF